ncbi:O-acetyltransferase OatA [Microbacterium sp. MM2322]|uniref:acyltransferase family protein n=1 Tax=unclassified Microbacterium TaxID=2609290 RepID=UPI00177C5AD7|nr:MULTISPECIES: acyltransferase [unclassified Microbacterium]MBD8206714.1 acyltransferase [Microbacterium sp. CFBP 8801]MBD8477003.1 acyltransferase [Microbacterium sp. CFBP 8794]MBD8509133.1 acyltransferase [Microbacterium sp. CFBP 8790]
MTISTMTASAPTVQRSAAEAAPGPLSHVRNLPSLTGLRWATAMLIFGHHIMAVEYFGGNAGVVWGVLFEAGKTGVTLFFILSGFVLAWGYKPQQSARSFWWHRFARVYPLHLVGVGLALVAAATLVPEIRADGAAPVVANVLLVNGWVPDWWQAGNPASWSLVCEAFFYLSFPFLIRPLVRASNRTLVVVVVASLVLVALMPQIAAVSPVPLSAASTPLLRMPEFVIGVSLALLMKNSDWRPVRLALAVPLALAGYALSEAPTLPGTDVHPGLAATVGFFALLVASLADADARSNSTFLARPLWQELGRVSFAFYLVHLLVIASVSSAWPDGHPQLPWRRAVLLALAAFGIALAIAWVLHKAVEVPAQRWLLRRDRARATARSTATLATTDARR